MDGTLSLKALIRRCVAAELARDVSDPGTARTACLASFSLRAALPKRLWGRADDVVAGIVRAKLERARSASLAAMRAVLKPR